MFWYIMVNFGTLWYNIVAYGYIWSACNQGAARDLAFMVMVFGIWGLGFGEFRALGLSSLVFMV